MGIDNYASLIIGWKLDNEKFKELRTELGYEECCCSNGYFCSCDCDRLSEEGLFSDKFCIEITTPFHDSPFKYRKIFLTYDTLVGDMEFEKMSEIIADTNAFESVKEFVEKMGGDSGKPHIIASPHVC